MAQVFRYPLTRFCLRAGTLTLPRVMLGLFPEDGDSDIVDTSTGERFTVTTSNARTVGGVDEFFRRHQLAVNDELLIEALDDGTFAVTPVPHTARTGDASDAAMRRVLDELHDAAVPVTEGEVRALFPDLPADIDVVEALEEDGRFALHRGRWHTAAALDAAEAEARGPAAAKVSPAGERAPSAGDQAGDQALAVAAHSRASASTADAAAGAAATAERHASATSRAEQPTVAGHDVLADDAARAANGAMAQHLGTAAADPGAGMQAALWGGVSDQPGAGHGAAGHGAAGHGARVHAEGLAPANQGSVLERRTPALGAPQRRVDADVDEDDGASLEATELANRLRLALAPLGFRLEPVALGQLNLHADMGRRSYRVLVQLLCRSKRLDWADLLARRRTSGVRYLAVVGDHRDLLRLTNPAELARATLWSWQALDRMSVLHRTVPLSPIELEAHFERDGLFEQGLKRLEDTVAQRVGERGAMSEVLARLAVTRSPSVFLLEELAGELGMSRELALRILERLADAPFHLVAKVDAGEFVLRQSVGDALEKVASYATSLRERLPSKRVERLVASAEPDLLTDVDAVDLAFGAGTGVGSEAAEA